VPATGENRRGHSRSVRKYLTLDGVFPPVEGLRGIEDIPCAILLSAPDRKFGDVFFVDRINTIYRMNG